MSSVSATPGWLLQGSIPDANPVSMRAATGGSQQTAATPAGETDVISCVCGCTGSEFEVYKIKCKDSSTLSCLFGLKHFKR